MSKDFIFSRKAGSRKTNEPRPIGDIIKEMLQSDSPLARAYRSRQLFKDLHPQTELGVDLKLLTCRPGRMAVGTSLEGTVVHDDDDHYTVIENAPEKKKVATVRRNPVVYSGGCINVHRLADGTLRLEFNRPRFYPDFSFRDFCLAAAQELLSVACLLGEEASEE